MTRLLASQSQKSQMPGVSCLGLGRALMRALPALCLLLPSCAFHTYDAETGTAHLWGLGHLRMGVQSAEDDPRMQAITIGTDTVGLSADGSPGTSGGGVGWRGTQVSYFITQPEGMAVTRQPVAGLAHESVDEETSTAHLWGAGHLALSTGQPLQTDKVEAVVAASDTLGTGAGTTLYNSGLSLGWRSSRMAYLNSSSTSMRIVRPNKKNFTFTRSFSPQKK